MLTSEFYGRQVRCDMEMVSQKNFDGNCNYLNMKIYVETYGCALNKADTEVILGILTKRGIRVVDSVDDATIIIVNTCGVKAPTEFKILKRLKELRKLSKPIIVAGCLPKINLEKIKETLPDYAAILGPDSYESLPEIILQIMSGQKGIINLNGKPLSRLTLPSVRTHPVIGIVPISQGCLGNCSYCAVKFARGRLISYSPEDIVKKVKQLLLEGCKEIWLTAQDTAVYGIDIGYSLPQLLEDLVELPYEYRIRVGMMNPAYLKQIVDELIEVFKSPKIYKFLHIPVQSGSNRILKKMNRKYTIEEFKELVKLLRTSLPKLTLSTDVIVGFPGETEEDFQETIKLLEEVQPDITNVSRFAVRPRTEAEKMSGKLPGWKIKERSRKVSKIVRKISLQRNLEWIGYVGEALVSEIGIKGGFVARNFAYKPIIINSNETTLGSFVKVKIVDANITHLVGKIV